MRSGTGRRPSPPAPPPTAPQHPKVSKLAEEACGAGEAGKTNSVDSSSTAARGGAHLLDTGTLLPPLRQISLDVIQATELGRGAGVYRQGSERHNIFQDVFNEVRAQSGIGGGCSGGAAVAAARLPAGRAALPIALLGGPAMRLGGGLVALCALHAATPAHQPAQPSHPPGVARAPRPHAPPAAPHTPPQLAGKDELAPLQAGTLYTLPSMQFLESMLSDFEGSRAGAAASAPGAPGPLDLPADAFDLPDTWGPSTSAPAVQQGDSGSGTGALRPTPFDQSLALQQQAAAAAAMIHQRAGAAPSGHRDSTSSYSGFVPMGSSASAPVALAPAAPAHSGVSGMSAGMSVALPIPRAHTATYPTQLAVDPRLQQQQLLALQQQQAARMLAAAQAASQPVRGPAAPQPKNTPRRQSHAYADFDYEEPEVSLQTSKSGRVRKVSGCQRGRAEQQPAQWLGGDGRRGPAVSAALPASCRNLDLPAVGLTPSDTCQRLSLGPHHCLLPNSPAGGLVHRREAAAGRGGKVRPAAQLPLLLPVRLRMPACRLLLASAPLRTQLKPRILPHPPFCPAASLATPAAAWAPTPPAARSAARAARARRPAQARGVSTAGACV